MCLCMLFRDDWVGLSAIAFDLTVIPLILVLLCYRISLGRRSANSLSTSAFYQGTRLDLITRCGSVGVVSTLAYLAVVLPCYCTDSLYGRVWPRDPNSSYACLYWTVNSPIVLMVRHLVFRDRFVLDTMVLSPGGIEWLGVAFYFVCGFIIRLGGECWSRVETVLFGSRTV